MYEIRYSQSTRLKKELKQLQRSGNLDAFQKKVSTFLKNRPLAGKPLSHELSGLYRIRFLDNWRIIYKVDTVHHIVLILAVALRSDVYDDPDELTKRID